MLAVAAVVVVLQAQHASVKVEGLWEALVVWKAVAVVLAVVAATATIVAVAAEGVGRPTRAQLSG